MFNNFPTVNERHGCSRTKIGSETCFRKRSRYHSMYLIRHKAGIGWHFRIYLFVYFRENWTNIVGLPSCCPDVVVVSMTVCFEKIDEQPRYSCKRFDLRHTSLCSSWLNFVLVGEQHFAKFCRNGRNGRIFCWLRSCSESWVSQVLSKHSFFKTIYDNEREVFIRLCNNTIFEESVDKGHMVFNTGDEGRSKCRFTWLERRMKTQSCYKTSESWMFQDFRVLRSKFNHSVSCSLMMFVILVIFVRSGNVFPLPWEVGLCSPAGRREFWPHVLWGDGGDSRVQWIRVYTNIL